MNQSELTVELYRPIIKVNRRGEETVDCAKCHKRDLRREYIWHAAYIYFCTSCDTRYRRAQAPSVGPEEFAFSDL